MEIFQAYEKKRRVRENLRRRKNEDVKIIKIYDPSKEIIDNCDSESGGEDDRCEVM